MPDSKPQALFRVNLAQRLLSPSGPVRRNPYFGHASALFSFLAALALRFVLDPVLPPGFPFITFFPAVLLTAFLAGWRPATVYALLSGFSSWYWFLGAPGSFTLNLGTALAMGFFTFIVLVDILVIEAVAQSNDRLALREAQLETIVETVPVGLVMAEFPSGRIVGGNRYVEQLVRHPVFMSPDIHSYDEWVSFHADGSRVSGHEYPLARMILEGEENPNFEVQYQRGDGTRAWMLITGRPVKDAAGGFTGGVVALVDIDEEHRAKEALAEALRAKSTLLYEVNHREKNSLQMLTGLMLVEASKIKDEAAKQAFLTVRSKVSSIAQLHHRLYGDGAHNAIGFGLFLKDVAEEFVQSLGNSKVLRIDTSAVAPGSLLIDVAAPLAMLSWELLTNCFKHAYEQDGLVHVRFNISGDQAVLEVADEGAGLPEGFDLQSTRSIGMEIVRGLVKQLDARIEVVSGSGKGTSFRMFVPLSTPARSSAGSEADSSNT